MSKRIRDALQHQPGVVGPKKPKRSESTTAGCRVVAPEEEYGDERSCRPFPSTAPLSSPADAPTATANAMIAGGVADDGGIRWRRLLWLCGMGMEDLVLGWFPFSEEDFVGQACGDEDDDGQYYYPFDDIWQIKHIYEIPKPNTAAATTSSTTL